MYAFANGCTKYVRSGHNLVDDRFEHLLDFGRQVAFDVTASVGQKRYVLAISRMAY